MSCSCFCQPALAFGSWSLAGRPAFRYPAARPGCSSGHFASTQQAPASSGQRIASVVSVRGSAALVPAAPTLASDWLLPPDCSSHPQVRVLPAGTKRLSAFPTSGSPEDLEEQSSICAKFGIPWVPKDFVSQAVKCKHPKLLATALPGALKECIDYCMSKTPVEVAQERTANLRKWLLRAKELKAEADEPLISQHCSDILANKSMRLLGEMIDVSGYGDSQLPKDIGRGFDLLGPIPDSSGVLPKKASFASLSVPEVREVANDNQRCVWQATMDSLMTDEDLEVARVVYKLTLSEKDAGWVKGPFALGDLPKDAIRTRLDGSIKKIRPIDDFTESLANQASGPELFCCEWGAARVGS